MGDVRQQVVAEDPISLWGLRRWATLACLGGLQLSGAIGMGPILLCERHCECFQISGVNLIWTVAHE